MDARAVISLGTIYVFIYYLLGKYLVHRISLIRMRDSAGKFGGKDVGQTSILSVVFDDEIPEQVDSAFLKIVFYIVKFMLVASPLVFILVFFLL